jgi:hypothetical protein
VDSDVIQKIREFFIGKDDSRELFSPLEQLVIFGEASDEVVDVKKNHMSHKPPE